MTNRRIRSSVLQVPSAQNGTRKVPFLSRFDSLPHGIVRREPLWLKGRVRKVSRDSRNELADSQSLACRIRFEIGVSPFPRFHSQSQFSRRQLNQFYPSRKFTLRRPECQLHAESELLPQLTTRRGHWKQNASAGHSQRSGRLRRFFNRHLNSNSSEEKIFSVGSQCGLGTSRRWITKKILSDQSLPSFFQGSLFSSSHLILPSSDLSPLFSPTCDPDMATSPQRTSSSSRTDDMEKNDDFNSPEPSVVVEPVSKGVRQMEQLNKRMSTKYRICLYTAFTVLAYVMSL